MVFLVCVQRHFLPDEALNVAQVGALVLLVAEGDGDAISAGPACAAVPVHVGLRNVGDLEVDDVAELVHIDATGGDVGGHEHAEVAALEGFHGLLALGLALVAVDRLAAHALFAKVSDQFVGTVFGAGEDQCTGHTGCGQHIDEQVLFLRLAHEVHFLLDRFRRAASALYLDGHRVEQDRVSQLLDVLRHGGRKEQGLSPWGQELDDLSDVVDEAHVEHGVRLVEHEVLEVVQSDVALVDEVQEAPRCGHDNVHATLECCDLLALFDPAEDDRVMDLQVRAVVPDAVADLGGEFAGWAQDEGADDTALVSTWLLGEPVQHGQGEGGRFAGAGLGHAQHIASVENVRDGLSLNGGRGLIPKG